jgi:(4S)-4-hydroxy-5-phosphonooxypentane-2,3-dione isomerase
MPVTYVIKFNVVPEQRESAFSMPCAAPMFHEAVLHRSPDSENHFMLYETWESHDDVLAQQIHRSYRKAWADRLTG